MTGRKSNSTEWEQVTMEYDSSGLKYGKEGENDKFTAVKPGNTTSSQVIKVIRQIDSRSP